LGWVLSCPTRRSSDLTRGNGVPQAALAVNALFGAVVAGLFALGELDPIGSLVPSMIGFGTLCVLALQMLAALSIVVWFRRARDRSEEHTSELQSRFDL